MHDIKGDYFMMILVPINKANLLKEANEKYDCKKCAIKIKGINKK